jgi:hypothetical protein
MIRKLITVEYECDVCHAKVVELRTKLRDTVLPEGWHRRQIPNCGLTRYTCEEHLCGLCAYMS